MQTIFDNLQPFVQVATPVTILALSLILRNAILTHKLEIQKSIAELKHEFIKTTYETKEDLTRHNASLASDVRTHIAADDTKFDIIQKSLERIEQRNPQRNQK